MFSILITFLGAFWNSLTEMAPYLLLGFGVSGCLAVWVKKSTVERHLSRPGWQSVLKATLFGIPLPLCSCGVIPVAASIRRQGASKGATAAFLLTTPQTGVDSIAVTWSVLGPALGLFRVGLGLVSGVVVGMLVSLFDREDSPTGSASATGPTAGLKALEAGSGAPACQEEPAEGRLRGALRYAFLTLPSDIGNSLLVGLVLAALIAAAVSPEFVSAHLSGFWMQMLGMLAISIPLYVCATGSVPIAAALLVKGVAPGAVLVFLMAGPATNAATVTTIWRVMGRRTALLYVFSTIVCALAAGVGFEWMIGLPGLAGHAHAHEHGGHQFLPAAVEAASAVLILALLVRRWVEALMGRLGRRGEGEAGQERITLTIEGISCQGCVAKIVRALGEGEGVRKVSVDQQAGRAIISGRGLDLAALSGRVDAIGFKVVAGERC